MKDATKAAPLFPTRQNKDEPQSIPNLASTEVRIWLLRFIYAQKLNQLSYLNA